MMVRSDEELSRGSRRVALIFETRLLLLLSVSKHRIIYHESCFVAFIITVVLIAASIHHSLIYTLLCVARWLFLFWCCLSSRLDLLMNSLIIQFDSSCFFFPFILLYLQHMTSTNTIQSNQRTDRGLEGRTGLALVVATSPFGK